MIAATALGLVLLVALPIHALLPRRPGRPKRSMTQRYVRTTIQIAVLLAAVMLVSLQTDMTAQDLGLGWPPGPAGEIGLLLAALILVGLAAAILLMKPSKSPREQGAISQLPRGRREMTVYLTFSLAAGFGWEVLYRGFLLWWLMPLIGLTGAVTSASVAYGLAHGWENWRQGLASIGSAFLFTIAFAVTGSLWWLIAIHTGLPLVALLARGRAGDRTKEALSA